MIRAKPVWRPPQSLVNSEMRYTPRRPTMRGTWMVMLMAGAGAGSVAAQEHEHHGQGTVAAAEAGDRTPLYDNLGTYHRAVTTGSAAAQRYFDQGLRLTYGFNHDEAIKSYRE